MNAFTLQVYEPSELERGHLTDRDNVIRQEDMPERFQVSRFPRLYLIYIYIYIYIYVILFSQDNLS